MLGSITFWLLKNEHKLNAVRECQSLDRIRGYVCLVHVGYFILFIYFFCKLACYGAM